MYLNPIGLVLLRAEEDQESNKHSNVFMEVKLSLYVPVVTPTWQLAVANEHLEFYRI